MSNFRPLRDYRHWECWSCTRQQDFENYTWKSLSINSPTEMRLLRPGEAKHWLKLKKYPKYLLKQKPEVYMYFSTSSLWLKISLVWVLKELGLMMPKITLTMVLILSVKKNVSFMSPPVLKLSNKMGLLRKRMGTKHYKAFLTCLNTIIIPNSLSEAFCLTKNGSKSWTWKWKHWIRIILENWFPYQIERNL